MNKYGELSMKALDIIKNADICRGCVGSCNDCEYSWALDRIEDAIYDYCKLKEKETPKVPLKINRECSMDSIGDCPNCGAFIESFVNEFRCSVCGQAIDWSDGDE